MPLYEYECTACHRRTEKIQKFSDPELTTCPHCGARLERTLTAPAVQFKGSGWYKDLYSSAKPAASGNAEGVAPAAASSEASAPAAKADAPAASTSAPASTPAPASSTSNA